MSVHRLPDGRWICKFPAGTIPDQPRKTKQYFGRGDDARRAAEQYNAELGIGAGRKDASAPSFYSLTVEYLAAKERTLAESTLYLLRYKLASTILPVFGELQAHEITYSVLDRYVANRLKMVRPSTVCNDLTYVRAILRWSAKRGLIAASPIEGYEFPRAVSERIYPPTDAEIEAILAHSPPHLQRIILICMYTGIRPGPRECFGLRWDDVDLGARLLRVRSAAKGGIEHRDIPLAERLYKEMLQWHAEDGGKGWLIHYHGKRIYRHVDTAWIEAKRKAGVTRKLSLYTLRHRAATLMLTRGVPAHTVAALLGHRNISMTLSTYAHVLGDDARDAISKL